MGGDALTCVRLRRTDLGIGVEAGGLTMLQAEFRRRPTTVAAITGIAGTSIVVLDLAFVAVAFEPVAFAFIALLLVSTATFAAVHQ